MWADGIVVVYDVGNAESFVFAKNLIERIKHESKISSYCSNNWFSKKRRFKPVILIGNKSEVLVS